MKIVAHRGLWKKNSQKNSLSALLSAVEAGFEIETDVRDSLGNIVVSHDAPSGGEPKFEELLKKLEFSGEHATIAVNVKSDGMSTIFKTIVEKFSFINFYFFDMSGPEHRKYELSGLTCLSRVSEFESRFLFGSENCHTWFDAFVSDAFLERQILESLGREGQFFMVSPELHGRDKGHFWNYIKDLQLTNNYHLCTDYPLEAKAFFET